MCFGVRRADGSEGFRLGISRAFLLGGFDLISVVSVSQFLLFIVCVCVPIVLSGSESIIIIYCGFMILLFLCIFFFVRFHVDLCLCRRRKIDLCLRSSEFTEISLDRFKLALNPKCNLDGSA